MYLFGQLQNAQLENKSSDYSVGPVGRIWWNTTTAKAMVDDGTNIRAFLRNDAKAVFGTSGTASENIRFHRGAAGVLQFVSGADTTSEGTLSTSLNQISAKLESYTTAGLPAAGNAGRTVWDTTASALKTDNGASWTTIGPGASLTSPVDVQNISISCSVGSSALTIALKDSSGADPSAGSPCKIPFRNSTLTTGDYTVVSVTAATSIVISSGSTLGHRDGQAEYIYVYALNNSGTVELAVCNYNVFDEGKLHSTTAEGGAGGADGIGTLYSTTARTSKALKLIARLRSTQTTAGTWAAVPTEIALVPYQPYKEYTSIKMYTTNGYGSNVNNKIRRWSNNAWDYNSGVIAHADSATVGSKFTINESGIYAISYVDQFNSSSSGHGITLNSSDLTDDVSANTLLSEKLVVVQCSAADRPACAATTVYLRAGDIIRTHTSGTTAGANTHEASVTITKIA